MDNIPSIILQRISSVRENGNKKLDLSGDYRHHGRLTEIPLDVFDLLQLEELNLSSNDITSIPREIGRLKNLKSLNLSFNKLENLPKEVGELDLESLSIKFNKFSLFPPEITKIKSLKQLDVSINEITSIPPSIKQLNNLTQLELGGNPLEEINYSILPFGHLELLDIPCIEGAPLDDVYKQIAKLGLDFRNRKDLKKIPSWVFSFENVNSLNISSTAISEISGSIEKLQNLETLWMSNISVIKVSKSITKLGRLTNIGMSKNNLLVFPAFLTDIHSLERIVLTDNSLKVIPPDIGDLENLKSLILANNQLETLPIELGKLVELKTLHLYNNFLASLPESFRNLRKLENLSLWNNRFNAIPDVVYALESIKDLDFKTIGTGNKITQISRDITKLKNLTSVDFTGNPIDFPPPEIVSQGIDAIRNFFRQLESEGTDYLFEAKLLILGEGGAGKTTLAKKIDNPNYLLQDSEKSTEGIDVSHCYFTVGNNKRFQINIWDFGGQEIYHATHQFFLTKRSLYILVADTRKDDTDFYYWLNVIELLSNNSPILIIKNEKQDRHREINESQLRGQFANLKEVLSTNLATNRGLDTVLASITYNIGQLPHVGTPLPKTWVKIRETLEGDDRTYISYGEFVKICNQNNFFSEDDQVQLIGFFHDLGICLHFQDDPMLQKIVILKPKWGTDAAYKVLDNKGVIKNLGHFTKLDLVKIWHEDEYKGMHSELLQLMMKFKLCYMVPESDGVYIAPQLLTENQPNYDWDATDNLILRYAYEFMPKGIVTQFIVVMHSYIFNKNCVWKSGVVLERDDTKAEIIEYYGKREVRIRITGKNKKEFMAIVTYELSKIHTAYKHLKYNELVPCKCKLCHGAREPHFYALSTLRKFAQDNQSIQCQKSYEMIDAKAMLDDVISREVLRKESEYSNDSKSISFEGANINQLIVQQATQAEVDVIQQVKSEENMSKKESSPKSAWANGLFYLFAFVVVITGLGVLANSVPWYTLALILVAAVIFVPLIGALQLRQDKNLSEKGFLELIGMVLRQLPIIERLYKK